MGKVIQKIMRLPVWEKLEKMQENADEIRAFKFVFDLNGRRAVRNQKEAEMAKAYFDLLWSEKWLPIVNADRARFDPEYVQYQNDEYCIANDLYTPEQLAQARLRKDKLMVFKPVG